MVPSPDRISYLKTESGLGADPDLPHAHTWLVRCRYIWLTECLHSAGDSPKGAVDHVTASQH